MVAGRLGTSPVRSEWHYHEADRTWEIHGRHCWIWMDARPGYCDRGRWLARLEVTSPVQLAIDHADGWPRYYFDLDRAKAEIEAWLHTRREWLA
jgi:hypothetical protein